MKPPKRSAGWQSSWRYCRCTQPSLARRSLRYGTRAGGTGARSEVGMLASGRGVCWRPNREASMARGVPRGCKTCKTPQRSTAWDELATLERRSGARRRYTRAGHGSEREAKGQRREAWERDASADMAERRLKSTRPEHPRQECGPCAHPPTHGRAGRQGVRVCAASPSRVEQVMNVAVRATTVTGKGAWCWEMPPTHIVINH
jgi:hypothetical protein